MTNTEVDFTGLIAEFEALSESVELSPEEAADLRERVLDLKAGKALEDELKNENKTLRDSIVADLLALGTRKVVVNGEALTSLSLPPTTSTNWELLNRLAPKAAEKAKYQTYAYRLNTGRIKA